MLFDDLHEKEFYMRHSMFIHLGKAWRFLGLKDGNKGSFHCVQDDGGHEPTLFDMDEVSTRSFRTGYMIDWGGKLRYIERIPSRQWRVGIVSSSVRDKIDKMWRFRFSDAEWFIKMHDDNYPDVDEARELAKGGKAYPFDYDFAIYKNSTVDYKGRAVGKIHNRKFLPLPGVEWIKELVDSVIERKFIGGQYGH